MQSTLAVQHDSSDSAHCVWFIHASMHTLDRLLQQSIPAYKIMSVPDHKGCQQAASCSSLQAF